jgi:hypothetical protein
MIPKYECEYVSIIYKAKWLLNIFLPKNKTNILHHVIVLTTWNDARNKLQFNRRIKIKRKENNLVIIFFSVILEYKTYCKVREIEKRKINKTYNY